MEYVMVPVPEELAPKVLSYIGWKGRARSGAASETRAYAASPVRKGGGATGDHSGPIARAFARLDDDSRAVVTAVAAAALDAEQLSIPEAARRAGVTTREAVGILFEVNNILDGEGAPTMGLSDLGGGLRPGEFTWDSRVVVMTALLARPVADVGWSRNTG
jgi:hypothetical protein